MKTRLAPLLCLVGVSGSAHSPGTFTATGSMTIPRAEHSATLLPNGKVLIAGAYSPTAFSQTVATAELYDPSTGAFTPTGNMTAAHAGHSAILLADGRVLIVGGPTELYDPSTGSFTLAGPAIPIPSLIAGLTAGSWWRGARTHATPSSRGFTIRQPGPSQTPASSLQVAARGSCSLTAGF